MDDARRIKGLDCGQRVQNWRDLMRIKWCPTGRDLWFALAIKLKSKDILKSSSLSSVHILEWLVASRISHVILSTVNPSNERDLTTWYTDDAFRTAEFEAILNTLKKVLLN